MLVKPSPFSLAAAWSSDRSRTSGTAERPSSGGWAAGAAAVLALAGSVVAPRAPEGDAGRSASTTSRAVGVFPAGTVPAGATADGEIAERAASCEAVPPPRAAARPQDAPVSTTTAATTAAHAVQPSRRHRAAP